MDVRSSRSRSRTPFVQLTRLEEENMAMKQKKTVERRTYTTRQKTMERLSSNDEVFIDEDHVDETRKLVDEKRRLRHKTSDYSSEEEHSAENGAFKSALQVYKEAGEYWNKYPKTDYTYSMNSRDRKEVAPGVPCMPNMSRKSLRRSMEPTSPYSVAETNHVARKTLNFAETEFSSINNYSSTNNYSSINTASSMNTASSINTASSMSTAVYRRTRTLVQRFYRSVTALFMAVYATSEAAVLWAARTYYKTVSRLFLFDTWLMQKSGAPAAAQSARKYGALIAIMLLPLLLFAGWTLWSNINQIIQENPSIFAGIAGSAGATNTVKMAKMSTKPTKSANFDVNALLSSAEFEQIINEHLNRKFSDFEMELTSIKSRINTLNAGLYVHEKNKCCRRQNIYLMEGGKNCINEVELNRRLLELKADLMSVRVQGTCSDEYIRRVVGEALAIYDADKTGLVDYALETSGGQIVSTRCTENYHSRTAVVSILGVPLWYPSNTPRVVITPGVTPGECWAFSNFPGFLVIQLSTVVRLSAVSVEHIPEMLAPGGARDSAPRVFSVWGLVGENDRDPWNFGTFEYRLEGPPLQYFPVAGDSPAFNMVELRVESNHGNMNYTCLYRFRVHGSLA